MTICWRHKARLVCVGGCVPVNTPKISCPYPATSVRLPVVAATGSRQGPFAPQNRRHPRPSTEVAPLKNEARHEEQKCRVDHAVADREQELRLADVQVMNDP